MSASLLCARGRQRRLCVDRKGGGGEASQAAWSARRLEQGLSAVSRFGRSPGASGSCRGSRKVHRPSRLEPSRSETPSGPHFVCSDAPLRRPTRGGYCAECSKLGGLDAQPYSRD